MPGPEPHHLKGHWNAKNACEGLWQSLEMDGKWMDGRTNGRWTDGLFVCPSL